MKRQVLSPTMKYSEEADLAPSPRDGLAASLPCIISEITQSQFSKSAVIYLHSLDAGASAYPLRPGLFVHDNTRVSGIIRSQPLLVKSINMRQVFLSVRTRRRDFSLALFKPFMASNHIRLCT